MLTKKPLFKNQITPFKLETQKKMDSFLRQTKAGSIPVTALAAEFDSPKQTMQTEAAC